MILLTIAACLLVMVVMSYISWAGRVLTAGTFGKPAWREVWEMTRFLLVVAACLGAFAMVVGSGHTRRPAGQVSK